MHFCLEFGENMIYYSENGLKKKQLINMIEASFTDSILTLIFNFF